ncbi:unnamed protein product [Didymodactylos carnosus]|uniref:Uncharacterized protein n=1 Tax=Didymodactylos carnosus TaxID=1234261 RepID=A0A815X7X6_9BILA|nr:unnamed protein product [Didymodactylos carnosus]CAF4415301.1 unnamed protein product [Didymodactylos carnosus]
MRSSASALTFSQLERSIRPIPTQSNPTTKPAYLKQPSLAAEIILGLYERGTIRPKKITKELATGHYGEITKSYQSVTQPTAVGRAYSYF